MVLAALPSKEEADLPFLGPPLPDELARAIAAGTAQLCPCCPYPVSMKVCMVQSMLSLRNMHCCRTQSKALAKQVTNHLWSAGDLDPITKLPFPEQPAAVLRQPLRECAAPGSAQAARGSARGTPAGELSIMHP